MSNFFTSLTAVVPADRVSISPEVLERLSKDFYWYSPILEKELKDKVADIAASPKTLDELKSIVRVAFEHEIPITVRGAGTGNYGQAIPLYGGLLIDLSGMDQIIEINPEGYVVAEPGVRLGAIEDAARKVGWELRCYPSTFAKSSLGGFLCGGSGGIGSITYGMLRENGTVRSVDLLTVEKEPRVIRLMGEEIFPAMRAYGTNGIMVRIELALGPKVAWGQIAATFDTFPVCFDFLEDYARNTAHQKRLVASFEAPIPSYFAPLKKFLPGDKAAAFLELDDAFLDEAEAVVKKHGGTVVFRQPHRVPRQGPLLSDYTWNHTTLWAKKFDSNLTYLQCGFDADRVREQFAALKEKFGPEFLLHVEFVKGGGRVVPGSIPIIDFTTPERLQEIIDFCGSIGVGVSNPHTYRLNKDEADDMCRRRADYKVQNDPKSLLNPGKLPDYPLPASLLTRHCLIYHENLDPR